METLKTLQQAIVYFSNPENAFQYALNFRWRNGLVTCPRCNSEKHSFIKTRRIWMCYGCNKQFSLKVGTIFEDSPITLDKWMLAMWMMANCKNGVSSHEMGRTIGVTQRSAWFMLHRIRKVMEIGAYDGPLGGGGEPVEVDETFVGGDPKNWHKERREKRAKEVRSERVQEYQNRFTHKTAVVGMLDRESRQIRAKVVPNVKRDTLQREILKTIKRGSKVHTDQAVVYTTLQQNYIHDTVNHAERYVRGEVHTNGLESFWSLLKRNLAGTYVCVEPFHLDRYLAEQVFRFNHRRDWNDQGRFELALSGVAGKRLTYKELTGAVGAATSH